LVGSISKPLLLKHPCLPTGHSDLLAVLPSDVGDPGSDMTSAIWGKATGAEVGQEELHGGEMIGSQQQQHVFVRVDGSSDFRYCESNTSLLLRKDENRWCRYSHGGQCSFAGVYQPPLRGKFVAFSAFWQVYKFLGIPGNSTVGELQTAVRSLCQMNLDQLNEFWQSRQHTPGPNHPKHDPRQKVGYEDDDGGTYNQPFLPGPIPVVPPKYPIQTYCQLGTYVVSLLHEGYGFPLHPGEHDPQLMVTGNVDGQKIDWALGAMLYETNILPYQYLSDDSAAGGVRNTTWAEEFRTNSTLLVPLLSVIGLLVSGVALSSWKVYQRMHVAECKLQKLQDWHNQSGLAPPASIWSDLSKDDSLCACQCISDNKKTQPLLQTRTKLSKQGTHQSGQVLKQSEFFQNPASGTQFTSQSQLQRPHPNNDFDYGAIN